MLHRTRFLFTSHSFRQLSPQVCWTGRRYFNMAQTSPFTKAVVASMRRLYPETLADKSFDNTGLLLEAPFQTRLPRKANSVLLTIDLTTAVADEAIEGNHSVVVAYHPIIFRGLKSLTFNDTQQTSLLRLAASGISVYSPHTAVDIVPGGMADWLCDIVTGKIEASTTAEDRTIGTNQHDSNIEHQSTSSSRQDAVPYSTPTYITPPNPPYFPSDILDHKRTVVTPSPESSITAANKTHNPSSLNSSSQPYNTSNTGAGRIITFEDPQQLSTLITRLSKSLGNPKAIQIAIPQTHTSTQNIHIKSIGLCPGSGSSVLRAASPPPDVILTGEMSHHEAWAIIERGGSLIALNHSNSERGYLSAVMQEKLQREVEGEWNRVRQEVEKLEGEEKGGTSLKEMIGDDSVSVVVSVADRDPFGMIIMSD